MGYRSFEELEVWKRACRVAVQVHKALVGCNFYPLKDQMARSAISIASNIAEGAERGSAADFIRFLHIAKGSAAELRTQIYIAVEIGNIIPDETQSTLVAELKELSRMLHGLITSLKI
ncbi:four helix bundle protein [Desulfatitalea alkaliphila]|uniref:Four helix bundle protein n=1 Tax=Desulfatitalea alkaliphila TaxID=2929485 RepID=A0AA41UM54_9BACT|nr:four helix bundle protein [Desulfatitalea alkaliphila]MCJ8503082.1 four helix bundle protein [Desulfatitalea alkaliphila]